MRERANVGTPENVTALEQAASLLRAGPKDLQPNLTLLLADVFTKWQRMGRFNPDFLNRVGGAETIALAHAVTAHLTPAPADTGRLIPLDIPECPGTCTCRPNPEETP